MCVNMEAQGFCQTVEPDADDIVKYCDDRLFLTAILRAIPNEMLGSLMRKEFSEITFKDGELVDDFSM